MLIITATDVRFRQMLTISQRLNQQAGYQPFVYNIGENFQPPPHFRDYVRRDWPLMPCGKIPYKPQIILKAMREHLKDIIWLDADAFVLRPLGTVFDGTFDVGVTLRLAVERPCGAPSIYGYVNAGVLFLRLCPHALYFAEQWAGVVQASESKSDQEALNQMLLAVDPLDEPGKVIVHPCGARIKLFSTLEYNWYYWPETPPDSVKIVHMKTDRRPAALQWLADLTMPSSRAPA